MSHNPKRHLYLHIHPRISQAEGSMITFELCLDNLAPLVSGCVTGSLSRAMLQVSQSFVKATLG